METGNSNLNRCSDLNSSNLNRAMLMFGKLCRNYENELQPLITQENNQTEIMFRGSREAIE